MHKPRTSLSEKHEHNPPTIRSSVAIVNLTELRELLEGEYTQSEIAVFTKRFSTRPRGTATSRTQVNRFLNGNLIPDTIDWLIVKKTLEWLMGVEIIYDHEMGEPCR